jgi:hypothetical protein
MKKLVGKNIHFQKMSSRHQGYQMFSLVVGEAQIHVSHCWFFGLPNIKHCKISN